MVTTLTPDEFMQIFPDVAQAFIDDVTKGVLSKRDFSEPINGGTISICVSATDVNTSRRYYIGGIFHIFPLISVATGKIYPEKFFYSNLQGEDAMKELNYHVDHVRIPALQAQ